MKKENKKAVQKCVPVNIVGETIGLIISLIFTLYIFPKLPFTTDTYKIWIPIGVTTSLLGYSFKVMRANSINHTFKQIFIVADNAVSLYAMYKLIQIFPFDFGNIGYPIANTYIKYAFYIALFGISMAIFVNFMKILWEKE